MPFQVLNSGQTAYIQYGALESIVVIINGPNKAKVGVKIGQPPPDSFEYGEASEGFAKKYLLDKKPAIIRIE
jgi:hypothetical protein